MNTRKAFSAFFGLLLAVAFFTACEEPETLSELSFSSTIEGLVSSDTTSNGAKVYLQNEKWIYWEDGDVISINSNTGEGSVLNYMAQLANINAGFINDPDGDWQDFNGLFLSSLPEGSRYFLGLHPYNRYNVITPAGPTSSDFSEVQIVMPDVQPATSDISFARNVFPMVAWYGGEWRPEQPSTPFNLDFHSLGGLVRIQFFTSGATASTIQSISFTEYTDQAISGNFRVRDYKTHYPYLEPVSGATTNTITMPVGRDVVAGDGVITCYLVLPATTPNNGYTRYHLSARVTYAGGVEEKLGDVTVSLRRNGITYIRALDVNNNSNGLVGNGTPERPYKIYTVRDMQYVLSAFGGPGAAYINGREVTEQTVFHVMRNDIILKPSNWLAGIPGFKGRMIFKAQTSNKAGIVNISGVPIFESVSPQGIVEDIPVRAAGVDDGPNGAGQVYNSDEIYSPLVHTNYGTIANCRVLNLDALGYDTLVSQEPPGMKMMKGAEFPDQGVQSAQRHLAGICAINHGLIIGCNSEAYFATSAGNVAGICYENYGTIRNCAAATPMQVGLVAGEKKVAGICHRNVAPLDKGIYDSYFTMNQTEGNDFHWSGIVSSNASTVEHCYTSATTYINTSGRFCGIAQDNIGVINYCYFQGRVTAPSLAGIVGFNSYEGAMTGTVTNCYVLAAQMIFPGDADECTAGGIADTNMGTIHNCFLYAPRVLKPNVARSYMVGAMAHEYLEGSVTNCYVFQTGTPIDPFFYVQMVPGVSGCFHVGPATAPAGVTVKTSSTASEMLEPLNAGRGSNGAEWELTTVGGVSIPVLKPYTRSNNPDPYPVITKGRGFARR